jgi:hypothetical protein
MHDALNAPDHECLEAEHCHLTTCVGCVDDWLLLLCRAFAAVALTCATEPSSPTTISRSAEPAPVRAYTDAYSQDCNMMHTAVATNLPIRLMALPSPLYTHRVVS